MKSVFLPAVAGLVVMLAALPAAAQYKIIGPDGKVTYTDQPPADPKVKIKRMGASGSTDEPDQPLPFAIANAVRSAPVTLYTSLSCSPCAQGRQLLQNRGIPFSERTVSTEADLETLKTLGMENNFPVLEVGRNRISGYGSEQWNGALTSAGYPAQTTLPTGFQTGKASALAPQSSSPAPAPAVRRTAANTPDTPATPPPSDNGFRFQK
jgi:glutaredoxin